MADFTRELNRLAGTDGLADAGAANAWAGTSGLEVVGALNSILRDHGLGDGHELNGACRKLAVLFGGNATYDAPAALASINASGIGSTVDSILLESGDDILLESGYLLLLNP